MNNAVFLCAKCARIHQGINRKFSHIKSLEVDAFTPEEIKVLNLGGNDRYIAMMNEYNVPLDSAPDFKYHLQIAEYYRQLLQAESLKDSKPEEYKKLVEMKPSNEIGVQLLEGISTGNPNKQHEEVKNDFSYVMSNVGAMFRAVGDSIAEKAHQMGIDTKLQEAKEAITGQISKIQVSDKVKEAGNKTVEYAKKGGEFIADKTKKVYNSETFQNMARKAEQQYLDLKAKTQTYLEKDKAQTQTQTQQTPDVTPSNTGV